MHIHLQYICLAVWFKILGSYFSPLKIPVSGDGKIKQYRAENVSDRLAMTNMYHDPHWLTTWLKTAKILKGDVKRFI